MPRSSRPLLCWESRKGAVGAWQESDFNQGWAPTLPYYPDTPKLKQGDIVLFEPIHPTATQRLIRSFECGTFTHAAVYLGNDHLICEASAAKRKVVLSSLESTLAANCLLFRRVVNLGREGRQRMTEAAISLLEQKYDFGPLIEMVLKRAVGVQSALRGSFIKAPLICSTLCEHAIIAGLADGRSVTKRKGHLVMPEDLAATNLLEDIEVNWRRVEHYPKKSAGAAGQL